MQEKVIIYGKTGCPYTEAAIKNFSEQNTPVEFINVLKEPAALKRMLEITGGKRQVPVIVKGNEYTIGFNGT